MKLTAVFANGTATIDQGIGTVQSGTEVETPVLTAAGTTYTLTVTDGLQTVKKLVTIATIQHGNFTRTGSMVEARYGHTATLLPSGKVLIVGGSDVSPSSTAEFYDPSTGMFSYAPGNLSVPRIMHTATLMQDGRVLVVGGCDNLVELGTVKQTYSTAEVFAPSGGSAGFSPTGGMFSARCAHTATLLGNGRVLVAGGFDVVAATVDNAELFDPAQNVVGAFSVIGAMKNGRYAHTATLLSNGSVLLAGGHQWYWPDTEGPVDNELFSPSAFAFTATGAFVMGFKHFTTVARLPSGKVLVAGGSVSFGGPDPSSASETYDPDGGTNGNFSATGPMTAVRAMHTSTPLPNGKVLITGGYGNGKINDSTELFDPATGTNGKFAAAPPMSVSRAIRTATLLTNGLVLVAGGTIGGVPNRLTATSYAELYCP